MLNHSAHSDIDFTLSQTFTIIHISLPGALNYFTTAHIISVLQLMTVEEC